MRYSVRDQCRVLAVSRAGYYHWQQQTTTRRARENGALLERTRVLYAKSHGRYGSPRITRALHAEGWRCSRNRVARLMREDHLAARPKRRFTVTTQSDHRKASRNLLDRNFHVSKPNHAWTSDITYIETRQGWLYVAAIMDLCTRKIVGLAMRADLSQELAIDALRQAIQRAQPPTGLLLHSDRDVQYSSDAYRAIIREHGIRQSMSRRANCWDNAPMSAAADSSKR